MQDRFKFRFFETYNNTMIDMDDYNIQEIIDNGKPIMQSTGLKDKNGKLIYEGDIVKFDFDRDEIIAVVSWDDKELIGFYLNTTDYFKDKYVTDYELYTKFDYEVIGNIYENADLLKEGKE